MAIRSDEITSIIRSEIKGFDAGADVSGVGTIVEVGDGIAQIYGLSGALAQELLEFPNGIMGMAQLRMRLSAAHPGRTHLTRLCYSSDAVRIVGCRRRPLTPRREPAWRADYARADRDELDSSHDRIARASSSASRRHAADRDQASTR